MSMHITCRSCSKCANLSVPSILEGPGKLILAPRVPTFAWHTFSLLLFLTGGSLRSIAEAKAGIMKPSRPVVIAHQPHAEAREVLQWHAKQLNCPIVRPDDVIHLKSAGVEHAAEGVLHRVKATPHSMPWFEAAGKSFLLRYK